jgi:hypothetical protein
LPTEDILYCSNIPAVDGNNFPILKTSTNNGSSPPITDPASIKGATRPVINVNFLRPLRTLLDQGNLLSFSQVNSIVPYEACVRHFGKRYPIKAAVAAPGSGAGAGPYNSDPYVSASDPVYVSDSTYLPQPSFGWLNLPAIETLTAVLFSHQVEEWYVVGAGPRVDAPLRLISKGTPSPMIKLKSSALPINQSDFPVLGYDPVFPGSNMGIFVSGEFMYLLTCLTPLIFSFFIFIRRLFM